MDRGSEPAASPRTQVQRSIDMRARILDATVELLVESGFARTSTWAVCQRAQVSRGALLHHFPTRISLMVAAVSRLAEAPLDDLDETLARTPPREQLDVFISWLWSTIGGDLFAVGLELLTAARTEPALKMAMREGGDVLQQRLEMTVASIVSVLGHAPGGPLSTALLLSIPAIRGAGLDLAIDGNRKKHKANFDAWANLIKTLG